MCQLCLSNLGDPTRNRVFLSTILPIDSASGNQDGTGLAYRDPYGVVSVWKTELHADGILNLGGLIRDFVQDDSPVIAHVRAASKGIKVTAENAHPFEGERFIIAHNGRLYGKDEEVTYSNYSSIQDDTASDSRVFSEAMEKCSKENPGLDAFSILKMTMENFVGKFALLIYDKVEDAYWVARGSSAELHACEVFELDDESGERKRIGFVVNTKKTCLDNALTLSTQVIQTVSGKYVVYGDIKELQKDTVYKVVGDDLVPFGEVKENPVVYKAWQQSESSSFFSGSGGGSRNITTDMSNDIVRTYEAIRVFQEKHFLTIEDIDMIFYIFLGKSMANMSIDDMKDFIRTVIPRISASKKNRKALKEAFGGVSGKVFPINYTRVPDLEFPWMVSSQKAIDELVKTIKEISKKASVG